MSGEAIPIALNLAIAKTLFKRKEKQQKEHVVESQTGFSKDIHYLTRNVLQILQCNIEKCVLVLRL